MTHANSAAVAFQPSQRTNPLTEAEQRAALRAIHRLLVEARAMAYRHADYHELADLLDAAEVLPQSLLRPAEFDDLFRATLADLAEKYPAARGIHEEFTRTVG